MHGRHRLNKRLPAADRNNFARLRDSQAGSKPLENPSRARSRCLDPCATCQSAPSLLSQPWFCFPKVSRGFLDIARQATSYRFSRYIESRASTATGTLHRKAIAAVARRLRTEQFENGDQNGDRQSSAQNEGLGFLPGCAKLLLTFVVIPNVPCDSNESVSPPQLAIPCRKTIADETDWLR